MAEKQAHKTLQDLKEGTFLFLTKLLRNKTRLLKTSFLKKIIYKFNILQMFIFINSVLSKSGYVWIGYITLSISNN